MAMNTHGSAFQTCMPQRPGEARAPVTRQFGDDDSDGEHQGPLQYDGAVLSVLDMLYGGSFEVWVGLVTAVFAFTITIIGILCLELSHFQKVFSVLSLLFCCTQSFSLVQLIRNHILTSSEDEDIDHDHLYQRFLLRGASFTPGSAVYRITVVLGFFVAVSCSVIGTVVLPNIEGDVLAPTTTTTTTPPPIGAYSMAAPAATTTLTTTTTTTNLSEYDGKLKHLHPNKVMILVGLIFGLSSTMALANDLRDARSKEIWFKNLLDVYHGEFTAGGIEKHDIMKVLLQNSALVSCHAQQFNVILFLIFTLLCIATLVYAFIIFGAVKAGFGFLFAGIVLMLLMVFVLAKAFEDPPDARDEDEDPHGWAPAAAQDMEMNQAGMMGMDVFLKHIEDENVDGNTHRMMRTCCAGSVLLLGIVIMWYGISKVDEPFAVKCTMLFAILSLLSSFFSMVKAFFRKNHTERLMHAIGEFPWRKHGIQRSPNDEEARR